MMTKFHLNGFFPLTIQVLLPIQVISEMLISKSQYTLSCKTYPEAQTNTVPFSKHTLLHVLHFPECEVCYVCGHPPCRSTNSNVHCVGNKPARQLNIGAE